MIAKYTKDMFNLLPHIDDRLGATKLCCSLGRKFGWKCEGLTCQLIARCLPRPGGSDGGWCAGTSAVFLLFAVGPCEPHRLAEDIKDDEEKL